MNFQQYGFFSFPDHGGILSITCDACGALSFEPFLTTREVSSYDMSQANIQLEKHTVDREPFIHRNTVIDPPENTLMLHTCMVGRSDREDELFDKMRRSNKHENQNARK